MNVYINAAIVTPITRYMLKDIIFRSNFSPRKSWPTIFNSVRSHSKIQRLKRVYASIFWTWICNFVLDFGEYNQSNVVASDCFASSTKTESIYENPIENEQ